MRKVHMSVWGCVVCAVASLASGQECYQSVQSIVAAGNPVLNRFGNNVSVFGDRLFVVANDSVAGESGAYVYRRNGEEWEFESLLVPDAGSLSQCQNCCIAGGQDVVAVGVPRENIDSQRRGVVYVFCRDPKSGAWNEEAKLSTIPSERFGSAVSIEGDVLAVGSWEFDDGDASDAGAAFVFRRTNGKWEQEAQLINPNAGEWSEFGRSVLVRDGRVFVGAPGFGPGFASPGAVYVYTHVGTQWNFEQSLPIGSNNSIDFGYSIAVYGDDLIIGSPNDFEMGDRRGSIRLYHRSNGNLWELVGRFTAPDAKRFDDIGSAVAMNESFIVFGSPGHDEQRSDIGALYVMQRVNDDWTQPVKVRSPYSYASNNLGMSVALFGDELIAGAPGDRQLGANRGAVYSFRIETVDPADCNGNGVPDACDFNYDCNNNGIPDDCDILAGMSDCNGDLLLDVCEVSEGALDCNANLIPDECEVDFGPTTDCNNNDIPDDCDLATGAAEDCNGNGVIDDCERDDYLLDANRFGYFWRMTVPSEALWLNHFHVEEGKEWINHIVLYIHSNLQTAPIRLLVFDDPNNDGDPHDAKLLLESPETVPTSAGSHRFAINPVYVGQLNDSFFVGVFAEVDLSMNIDFLMLSSPSSGPSEDSWWGAGNPGEVNLQAMDGFSILPLAPMTENVQGPNIGVWVIRADATHYEGVPIECMCPGDLVMGTKFGSDGSIDTADLMELLSNWGDCGEPCAPFCEGDINSAHGLPDCKVDVYDLFALLAAWGACD